MSVQAEQSAPLEGVERTAWQVAASVLDPELPAVTIEDLGILRDVAVTDGAVAVTITPTYSGCPAMDTIRDDVVNAFNEAGYAEVSVRLVLSPAWTSDWMSESGKKKLAAYGVSPPRTRVPGEPVSLGLGVRCPQCGSLHTRELSRFGSTACKALYQCQRCLEPFDHFKEH